MDPQQLAILMALSGQSQQSNPINPAMNNNQMQNQAAQMPQSPLANGMNASLGASGGTSLGTPQDMYAAMMQQPPGSY